MKDFSIPELITSIATLITAFGYYKGKTKGSSKRNSEKKKKRK